MPHFPEEDSKKRLRKISFGTNYMKFNILQQSYIFQVPNNISGLDQKPVVESVDNLPTPMWWRVGCYHIFQFFNHLRLLYPKTISTFAP